jgi:hypothetical protein
MCEAFDEHAEECAGPAAVKPMVSVGDQRSRDMASSDA